MTTDLKKTRKPFEMWSDKTSIQPIKGQCRMDLYFKTWVLFQISVIKGSIKLVFNQVALPVKFSLNF